jgi:hypothetical protein
VLPSTLLLSRLTSLSELNSNPVDESLIENLTLTWLIFNNSCDKVVVVGASSESLHNTLCLADRELHFVRKPVIQAIKIGGSPSLNEVVSPRTIGDEDLCTIEQCNVSVNQVEFWSAALPYVQDANILSLNLRHLTLNPDFPLQEFTKRIAPGGTIMISGIDDGSHQGAVRELLALIRKQNLGFTIFEFATMAVISKSLDGYVRTVSLAEQASQAHVYFRMHNELGSRIKELEAQLQIAETQAHQINLSRLNALADVSAIKRSWSWRLTGGLLAPFSQNTLKNNLLSLKWSDIHQGIQLHRIKSIDANYCFKSSKTSILKTVLYVKSWREKNSLRKPFPGFNPSVYRNQLNLPLNIDPTLHFARSNEPLGPWQTQVITPNKGFSQPPPGHLNRIAVHIHVYYIELLDEILKDIQRNISRPDLLITFPDSGMRKLIEEKTARYTGNVIRIPLPINRGRDLGAFFTGAMKESVNQYDLLFHVHTKKSLGNTGFDDYERNHAQKWRRFALDNLIGSDRAPRMMDVIIREFSRNKNLGAVFPADPNVSGWGGEANCEFGNQLLGVTAVLPRVEEPFDFPIGSFFAVRPDAVKMIYDVRFLQESIPLEPLPENGTTLHALERLIGIVPVLHGFEVAGSYCPGTSR